MKSILLRRKHRYHLTPTGQDGFQGLCPLIGQGPHRGLDCLAKPYQNLGVQTVRLGQLASSLGEISHLAGINQPPPATGQPPEHQSPQAPALQWLQGPPGRATACRRKTNSSIPPSRLGTLHSSPPSTYGHVKLVFGHIYTSVSHGFSFSARPCMIRAHQAQTTVRALLAGAGRPTLCHGLERPGGCRSAAPRPSAHPILH